MKKRMLSLALCLCLLPVFSFASENPPTLGELKELDADLVFYCKAWNEYIGKEYDVDMTYDPDKYDVIKAMMEGVSGDMSLVVYNFDGMILECSWDHNYYSIRTNITGDHEYLWVSARACALMCVIAYNIPKTVQEMKQRFIQLSDIWINALTDNLGLLSSGTCASFDVTTINGKFTFDIIPMDDGYYLSYGPMRYPHNANVKE